MGSPGSVPAQMVANTFVTQYYRLLCQMPEIAYQFYTDSSQLARADANKTKIAGTHYEIDRVLTSLGQESWQRQIFTVDALNSFGGSVFVLVTGAMHRNNSTRKFVQSFMLALQDGRYYVLNDILRYLDDVTEPAAISVDNGSHGMHEHYEGTQIVSNAVPEASRSTPLGFAGNSMVRDDVQLPDNCRGVEQRGIEAAVAYQMNEGVTSINLVSLEHLSLENDGHSFLAEAAPAEKKSYAAILRLQGDSHMLAQTPFVSHQPTPYQPQSGSSHQQFLPSLHPPTQERQDYSVVENEVDSRSVYVGNLPPNMVARQLEAVMRKFGHVTPNRVSVRSNKDGGLYAFVDFEDPSSAQAAIEGSPIVVGGHKIYAEGRKSTYSGGRGRGRGHGQEAQARGMSQRSGSKSRSRSHG